MARTPILITGCQRSGTTMLNLILDSHPAIWSIDEDKFDYASLDGYLLAPMQVSCVSFKLPRFPHMFSFIEALPGCRVLWCVRNPFDTVASMLRLELPFTSVRLPWALHPAGAWREINTTFWSLSGEYGDAFAEQMQTLARINEGLMSQLGTGITSLKLNRLDGVRMAAFCWRIKNELPRIYKKRGVDFLTVCYEKLVTDPRKEVRRILDYIGVEWNDKVLMHHRLHSGFSIGNTSNTRSIDTNSVGTGDRHLSAEERELVWKICGNNASDWGYNPEIHAFDSGPTGTNA